MIDDDPRDGMWVALLGVIVAVSVCIGSILMFASLTREAPAPPTPVRITEDSPGWDCRTMGNKTCGSDDPRIVSIRVEEDGSYAAGCIPGWPCDDTVTTP